MTASRVLTDSLADLKLAPDATPFQECRRLGEPLLKVKDSTAPDLLLHARQAAEVCPSGAILLEE